MNITVVGTGYVGLVAGAGLADFGLNVICVDKDVTKIELLKNGVIPFYEPGLKELVERNVRFGRLSFSTDIQKAIKNSLVIFLAVGTPSREDGNVDLSFVKEVSMTIAEIIDDYKVIVTKSTVPVGTNRWIKTIIDENKKSNDISVDIVSNPEFLREGAAVEDFMRPDRVVLGSDSQKALAIVKDIYRPLYLIETSFIVTDLETAELIKYASNAFLATKISFINEIANFCEKINGNVHHVARAMGLDGRIGPKFLHAGPGFGGSCFPKDIKALVSMGKEHESPFQIVESVIRINDGQRKRVVEKFDKLMDGIDGKGVAVLGLSFKPNTSDTREAPAIYVIEELLKKGYNISCYDPEGMPEFKRIFPEDRIKYFNDPYSALKDTSCAIILTEWNEFRNLDLNKVKAIMKRPIILDMRNIYNPQTLRAMGFVYDSIGRP